MKRILIILALLLALLILATGNPVHAQSSPSCSFQPDGSIVCVVSGGGNNGGGNDGGGGNGGQSNNGNDAPAACTPGQHVAYQINSYDADTGICTVSPIN